MSWYKYYYFILLIFSLNGWADPAPQSYLDRPDITQVTAKAHPDLPDNWRVTMRGQADALAMMLENYPNQELYFLARDGELMYDMARILAQEDPALASRIHLLNVSRTNAYKTADLTRYLAGNGISESTLQAGKQIVFFDTGFAGSMPEAIKDVLPSQYHPQMQSHFLASVHPEIPSSRSFIHALDSNAGNRLPINYRQTIEQYEEMPRWMDRSNGFTEIDGRLHPTLKGGGPADGIVNPELARQYMEDLAHYMNQPETVARISRRREQWRAFNQALNSNNPQANVQRTLREFIESSPADSAERSLREAMARDFLEYAEYNSPTQITLYPEDIGLQSVVEGRLMEGGTIKPSNIEQIAEAHPNWRRYLGNQATGMRELLERGDYETILKMSRELRGERDLFSQLGIQIRDHLSGPVDTKFKSFLMDLIENIPNEYNALSVLEGFITPSNIDEFKTILATALNRSGYPEQYFRDITNLDIFQREIQNFPYLQAQLGDSSTRLQLVDRAVEDFLQGRDKRALEVLFYKSQINSNEILSQKLWSKLDTLPSDKQIPYIRILFEQGDYSSNINFLEHILNPPFSNQTSEIVQEALQYTKNNLSSQSSQMSEVLIRNYFSQLPSEQLANLGPELKHALSSLDANSPVYLELLKSPIIENIPPEARLELFRHRYNEPPQYLRPDVREARQANLREHRELMEDLRLRFSDPDAYPGREWDQVRSLLAEDYEKRKGLGHQMIETNFKQSLERALTQDPNHLLEFVETERRSGKSTQRILRAIICP